MNIYANIDRRIIKSREEVEKIEKQLVEFKDTHDLNLNMSWDEIRKILWEKSAIEKKLIKQKAYTIGLIEGRNLILQDLKQ